MVTIRGVLLTILLLLVQSLKVFLKNKELSMKVNNFVQENLITELSSEPIHNMQKLMQTYVRSATT
jgi:hypothetical protein